MKLTIPALNALMEKLESQPNYTTTTPGPRCPDCNLLWIVVRSRKEAWNVFHAGGPVGRECKRYRTRGLADTQLAAIELAKTL